MSSSFLSCIFHASAPQIYPFGSPVRRQSTTPVTVAHQSRWVAFLLVLATLMPAADAPTLAFYRFGLLYDERGEGVDPDVIAEVARRTGVVYRTVVEARARIWNELAEGRLHATVSGIRNADRDRFAWFIPYISLKNHVILAAPLATRLGSFADFEADPTLRFGVVNAFKHGAVIDAALERLRAAGRVEVLPTIEQVFRMLGAGRIQAMVAQSVTYRKYLPELGPESAFQVEDWAPDEAAVPHGLALSKMLHTHAEAEQIRMAIAHMRADGSLTRIFTARLGLAGVAVDTLLPTSESTPLEKP